MARAQTDAEKGPRERRRHITGHRACLTPSAASPAAGSSGRAPALRACFHIPEMGTTGTYASLETANGEEFLLRVVKLFWN